MRRTRKSATGPTKYRVVWDERDKSFTPNYGSWQNAFGANPKAAVYIWAFPMAHVRPNTTILTLEEAREMVVRQGKAAFVGSQITTVLGLYLGDEYVDFSQPVVF